VERNLAGLSQSHHRIEKRGPQLFISVHRLVEGKQRVVILDDLVFCFNFAADVLWQKKLPLMSFPVIVSELSGDSFLNPLVHLFRG